MRCWACSRLCPEHFEDSCFEQSLRQSLMAGSGCWRCLTQRLSWWAVPTIIAHTMALRADTDAKRGLGSVGVPNQTAQGKLIRPARPCAELLTRLAYGDWSWWLCQWQHRRIQVRGSSKLRQAHTHRRASVRVWSATLKAVTPDPMLTSLPQRRDLGRALCVYVCEGVFATGHNRCRHDRQLCFAAPSDISYVRTHTNLPVHTVKLHIAAALREVRLRHIQHNTIEIDDLELLQRCTLQRALPIGSRTVLWATKYCRPHAL